ncbi:CARDB domain-containing protein [Hymenobacter properus]|uniref:T9SS type A sorting domain-containing protein n=1 Tax=Hymenobacter properus TaxID=2791026 RepID=A0A931BFW9_9BACT|nr:CARDB domain-containing protein [Hymenobacter properus]MBF9141698.1 T9SS type A sorting domain-containing protein [Hymenobacter properus]MBR7720507.1 T9SS type A sorting domain-containing protein [Microvirga sp. SRT04]
MEQNYRLFFKGNAWMVVLVAVLCWSQATRAQTYNLPSTGLTSVTTCSGTLYDDGGVANNYSSNAFGGTTLVPSTAGNKIRLQFSTFNVDPYYDVVRVYDGSSTSAPLIGEYSNYNQPPASLYATNAAGTLTVVLQSDGYYTLSGFAASIACVTSVPLADLAVQGASVSPLSTVAGNPVSLSCSIYNIGAGTAASSNVGYYFSTDATLDASDVLLNFSTGYALNPGLSSYRSATATIPAGTAPGNYYILFVGDYQSQVTESNENNNVAAVNVTVVAPSIDLTIQQAAVSPLTTAVGTPINMNCYIQNTGNAVSPSSSVGFYLSTNATLDASDVLLTSQYGGALTTTYSSARYGTAAIPTGLTPGTYYILFVADYQNQVSETNETNNVASVAITVAPPGVDLVVQQESLYPYSGAAGSTVQASASIYNQGNVMATSSNMGFYLSTNTTLDASDVLLYTATGSALSANLASYRSGYLTIPAGTAPGTYYILFAADPTNLVSETNETNNVRSLPFTVLAPTIDLSVSSVYVSPNTVAAGGSANASAYLYNQGNAPASPANLSFYLSTNTTFDASDVLVGNQNTASLAGGNYASIYSNITVPAGTASGTYYLLFVADPTNLVAETNENNNVAYTTLTVTAPGIDLQVSQAYSSPYLVGVGGSIGMTSYIYNAGTLTSPSSTMGYYLSTNAVLDASDVLLTTVPGAALGANLSSYRTANAIIPASTAPGFYYILFVADPANAVSETNENNNLAFTTIQLTVPFIDLQMTQLYLGSNSMSPGGTMTVNSSVYNAGNTNSPSSNVGYYLSTNAILDASDVLLTTTTGGVLGSNQYNTSSGTVTIPTGTTAGNYYMLAVADPTNVVSESNENNNVAYYQFTVTGPFTGTVVPYTGTNTITTCSTTVYDHGGFGPYSDNANGTLVINPGTAASRVQLSFNSFAVETCCDALRIYDGPNAQSPLLATLNSLPTLPIQASPTNTSGALTLVFTSDGSVTGMGFDATVTCVAAPVVLSDLLLTQIGASPSSVPAGGNLTLSATVQNQGAGPAATSAVGYYLSTNQTLDASDVLLGSSAGSTLAAGSSANRQLLAATVPAATTPGAYYVLFVADPLNAETESNENNNLAALAVTVTRGLAAREQTAGYTVAVVPNPVTNGNVLRVQLSGAGTSGTASADLYNTLGQRVLTQAMQLGTGRVNQAELPTQGLATGVYTLRLTGSGLSVTRRVVIE